MGGRTPPKLAEQCESSASRAACKKKLTLSSDFKTSNIVHHCGTSSQNMGARHPGGYSLRSLLSFSKTAGIEENAIPFFSFRRPIICWILVPLYLDIPLPKPQSVSGIPI